MTAAQDFAEKSLDTFKDRMRISTTDENELNNLKKMLCASYIAILRLVGIKDNPDESDEELIFERARYVYNDALDEFLHNYEQDIRYAWLSHHLDDEEIDEEKLLVIKSEKLVRIQLRQITGPCELQLLSTVLVLIILLMEEMD